MDFIVQPLESPRWYMNRKLWIVAGVAVLVVVALILLFSGGRFAQDRVHLEISAPAEVSGGDLVAYKIKISNDSKTTLEESRLTIYYPNEVAPKTIDLGMLAKSSSQELTEQVYLTGSQGAIETLRVVLSFVPNGLASRLQKSAEAATTITKTSVPLTVVAPPTVINGETITYIVDYRNQTASEFTDLKLRLVYPDGFVIKSQTPRPMTSLQFERTDEWILPRLGGGDAGRISVIGTLSGREREGKLLLVILQKKVDDNYIDFERYDATSLISAPLLSASITVNNTPDYIAHLDDTLGYSILIENNSDMDIASLILRAKLTGIMADASTIRASGYLDTLAKTVSWNGAVIPELGLLGAHQSVKVPLEVKLFKSFPSSNIGARDSLVNFTASVETDQVPAQLAGTKLSAQDTIVTKISSAPVFAQILTLGSSDTPAQGPFPPKAGQKTFYVVRWTITNPANELKSAKISSVLLPGVDMAGILRVAGTAAVPVYNARTQTMVWDIGSVPGGVGVAFPAIELWFQIDQTPSINQVGSPVDLMKNINFEASDTLTAEKFVSTVRDTGSRDVSDSKENGTVQQ